MAAGSACPSALQLYPSTGGVGALRRRLSGVCVEGAVAERDIIGWHGPGACTPTGGLRKRKPPSTAELVTPKRIKHRGLSLAVGSIMYCCGLRSSNRQGGMADIGAPSWCGDRGLFVLKLSVSISHG